MYIMIHIRFHSSIVTLLLLSSLLHSKLIQRCFTKTDREYVQPIELTRQTELSGFEQP